MAIDNARYAHWSGELQSPSVACLALVRVALIQLFRRKAYWIVIGLGLLNFFVFGSIIYGVTQVQLPRPVQERLLERFGFSAQPEDVMSSGYFEFMQRQSVIVMILLAFSGSLLVGADFRMGSLPFYLARRIDRRHYIAGKLLAVSAVVSLLTLLPALILFVEYGLFTSSFDYWRANWRVPLAILVYGLVLCSVLSIFLVTLSAYLQRTAPIAIAWSSLFVMLATVARQLRVSTDNPYWNLLDPWRNIRAVGRLLFGSDRGDPEAQRLALWAAVILITLCGLLLVALVRRVRAVEIVR
jgi:ABC-2 type transport system permease protein